MKKYLVVCVVVLLAIGTFYAIKKSGQPQPVTPDKEIIFYYLPTCEWCQKVESEGTIEKIEQLGFKVNKINAAVGPIRHKFEGVPTFVIEGKVYTGYRTFEEIKELLGVSGDQIQPPPPVPVPAQPSVLPQNINFLGEKGEKVVFENGEVRLNAAQFNDNQAHFYNVAMPASPAGGPDGKIIYFFVVKDKNGIYRAAANACAVCFKTYKGFRQEGNEIVCNNCGNRYPVEKIATEKGGCNPGPINPNLEVKNGQIIIKQADINQVSGLF